MPAQFKNDQESVSKALSALLRKLATVAITDIEAINDATWHTAAEFDVDQTALEDALAASCWGVSKATAEAVLGNCTTTLPMRVNFDAAEKGHSICFGKTREGMSEPANAIVERTLTETVQRQERLIQQLTEELRQARNVSPRTLLGQLRLRETILLYVGNDGMKLTADLTECFGHDAMRDVSNYLFVLDNAPVSADVKDAIRKATNHGMNRW